jgi:hypothetical protein
MRAGLRDSATGFSVTVDTTEALRYLILAPRSAYFHLRRFNYLTLLDHRKGWLARKGNRFGRGGTGQRGQPINVTNVQFGGSPPNPNQVSYQVLPIQKTARTREEADRLIPEIRGDIYTGNDILRIHEEGQDIKSARYMAVPIRTRPATIGAFRARYPGKKLITVPSKRNSNRLVYEQTTKYESKPEPGRGGPRRIVARKRRLRWILTKTVEMNPLLQFYASWDALEQQRDQRFAEAADGMFADWRKGRT